MKRTKIFVLCAVLITLAVVALLGMSRHNDKTINDQMLVEKANMLNKWFNVSEENKETFEYKGIVSSDEAECAGMAYFESKNYKAWYDLTNELFYRIRFKENNSVSAAKLSDEAILYFADAFYQSASGEESFEHEVESESDYVTVTYYKMSNNTRVDTALIGYGRDGSLKIAYFFDRKDIMARDDSGDISEAQAVMIAKAAAEESIKGWYPEKYSLFVLDENSLTAEKKYAPDYKLVCWYITADYYPQEKADNVFDCSFMIRVDAATGDVVANANNYN